MSEEKNRLLKLLKIDKLIEHLVGYIDTKIELAKLDIEERIQIVLSILIQYIFLFAFMFVGIVFLSFAMGYYLGKVLDSQFFGFSIVALAYLLISLLVFLDKKNKIGSRIVEKIFGTEDNDNTENTEESTSNED